MYVIIQLVLLCSSIYLIRFDCFNDKSLSNEEKKIVVSIMWIDDKVDTHNVADVVNHILPVQFMLCVQFWSRKGKQKTALQRKKIKYLNTVFVRLLCFHAAIEFSL